MFSPERYKVHVIIIAIIIRSIHCRFWSRTSYHMHVAVHFIGRCIINIILHLYYSDVNSIAGYFWSRWTFSTIIKWTRAFIIRANLYSHHFPSWNPHLEMMNRLNINIAPDLSPYTTSHAGSSICVFISSQSGRKNYVLYALCRFHIECFPAWRRSWLIHALHSLSGTHTWLR